MKRKQRWWPRFFAGAIDALPVVATLVVMRAIDGIIVRYVGEPASWTFFLGTGVGIAAAYFWMWGPRRESE